MIYLHDIAVVVILLIAIGLALAAFIPRWSGGGRLAAMIGAVYLIIDIVPRVHGLLIEEQNRNLGLEFFGLLPNWYAPASYVAAGILVFFGLVSLVPSRRERLSAR